MVEKRKTGFEAFDAQWGGCYAGRGMLVSGRAHAGKTTFCLHFLLAGLESGEKGLLLTSGRAEDLLAHADGLGLSLRPALEAQRLLLIEYAQRTSPSSDAAPADPMLPPEGFLQLGDIIETHQIRRLAIDTALPWVAVPSGERVSERILSLVRAFDRLNLTTLYTLPRPASDAARALLACFEQNLPVCAEIEYRPPAPAREFRVSKYLGEPPRSEALPYAIASGSTARHVARPAPAATGSGPSIGFAAAVQSRGSFLNSTVRERTAP